MSQGTRAATHALSHLLLTTTETAFVLLSSLLSSLLYRGNSSSKNFNKLAPSLVLEPTCLTKMDKQTLILVLESGKYCPA